MNRAVVVLAVLLAGCSVAKPTHRVTLYSDDGEKIGSWESSRPYGGVGSVIRFDDKDGRDVRISGTWVVEEL